MENEIWKPVPGYEDYYEVSTLGRIRRIKGRSAGKILKGSLNASGGYLIVSLYVNKRYKYLLVHRVVAITFLPNPDNKPQVNHIDGNKLNNALTNLEWATQEENMQHAWKNGLIDKEKWSESRRKIHHYKKP